MKPSNEWKTLKVPPALHAVLKSEAASNGIALTDLAELILIDWLRRRGVNVPSSQGVKGTQPDLFLVGQPDRETGA